MELTFMVIITNRATAWENTIPFTDGNVAELFARAWASDPKFTTRHAKVERGDGRCMYDSDADGTGVPNLAETLKSKHVVADTTRAQWGPLESPRER